jgi:Uma2 family endonuclease
MSQPLYTPDIHHLITEDDTPVDNLPSEKQQRLLTEPLYSSWAGPGQGRSFLAAANVGIFYLARNPAIVPDMFLSLDVEVPPEWWKKEHRSYFLWEFGKPPEVVIEIVSNTEGEEDGEKKRKYARMRVSYYVIYDPQRQVMEDVLTVYRLSGFAYERQSATQFPDLKLGLTLWEGEYEGRHDRWLRWSDERGEIIPTGKERAERERERAEQEHERAERERERAEQERLRAEQESQRAEAERLEKERALEQLERERQRAARLAEMLRKLGQDPDQNSRG